MGQSPFWHPRRPGILGILSQTTHPRVQVFRHGPTIFGPNGLTFRENIIFVQAKPMGVAIEITSGKYMIGQRRFWEEIYR